MPPSRECGSCTLCCKLVPVPVLAKVQNQRCPHQRHGKGCAIYSARPLSCRAWHCAWLDGPANEMLRRPDHVHYVIDCMLDTIASGTPEDGYTEQEVVQVWADPKHLEAVLNAPDLRAWLEQLNAIAIVRFERDAPGKFMCPPKRSADGEWFIGDAGLVTNERKQELLDAQDA